MRGEHIETHGEGFWKNGRGSIGLRYMVYIYVNLKDRKNILVGMGERLEKDG